MGRSCGSAVVCRLIEDYGNPDSELTSLGGEDDTEVDIDQAFFLRL